VLDAVLACCDEVKVFRLHLLVVLWKASDATEFLESHLCLVWVSFKEPAW
jgi:hypothetical protein